MKNIQNFGDKYHELILAANNFIKAAVKKGKISFGTAKQLKNENFVYDELPRVSLYDKNGLQTDDYAVTSVFKDSKGVSVNVLGLEDNIGESFKVDLSTVDTQSRIYIADAIADKTK